MLMPGISSPRVPLQIRLFISITVALVLAPLLFSQMPTGFKDYSFLKIAELIAAELGLGIMIGLIGRVFFLALQFLATGISNFVGVGTMAAPAIEENEPAPIIANFITLMAVILLFAADLHLEFIQALMESYVALPITQVFLAEYSLGRIQATLTTATILALQISAPFIIFSIIINFTFGLVNKLTPQIPVYFISLPFVICGGLFVLYFTLHDFLLIFIQSFSAWLAHG